MLACSCFVNSIQNSVVVNDLTTTLTKYLFFYHKSAQFKTYTSHCHLHELPFGNHSQCEKLVCYTQNPQPCPDPPNQNGTVAKHG